MVSMHNISERAVGGRVHGARLLDLTKMLSTVRGALLGTRNGFKLVLLVVHYIIRRAAFERGGGFQKAAEQNTEADLFFTVKTVK